MLADRQADRQTDTVITIIRLTYRRRSNNRISLEKQFNNSITSGHGSSGNEWEEWRDTGTDTRTAKRTEQVGAARSWPSSVHMRRCVQLGIGDNETENSNLNRRRRAGLVPWHPVSYSRRLHTPLQSSPAAAVTIARVVTVVGLNACSQRHMDRTGVLSACVQPGVFTAHEVTERQALQPINSWRWRAWPIH